VVVEHGEAAFGGRFVLRVHGRDALFLRQEKDVAGGMPEEGLDL
jgi:hypothetical protein